MDRTASLDIQYGTLTWWKEWLAEPAVTLHWPPLKKRTCSAPHRGLWKVNGNCWGRISPAVGTKQPFCFTRAARISAAWNTAVDVNLRRECSQCGHASIARESASVALAVGLRVAGAMTSSPLTPTMKHFWRSFRKAFWLHYAVNLLGSLKPLLSKCWTDAFCLKRIQIFSGNHLI